MNPTIYADRIFYYESVIAKPEELVALIESTDSILTNSDAILPWREWRPSDNPDYLFGYQKQTDPNKLVTSSEDVKYIYSTLWETLIKIGENYTAKLGLKNVPPSPLSISKYIVGGSMGAHVDDYNQPGVTPVMSGVIYLNDDVEGGEIDFPEQGVRIKPKAGSVVVFPSVKPFYHQSLPVTKGQKYMSPVFWVDRG